MNREKPEETEQSPIVATPGTCELSPANPKEPASTTGDQIKHPLERSWTIWFYSNSSKNWEDNQVEITSFDTVEDFWCLYHHMKLPSELEDGQDFAVFQRGISPMWEDAANRQGGRLLITLDRKNLHEVDRIWLDTVLLMIGENFEDFNNLVRGVVVNYRHKYKKQTKIGIWLADKNNKRENIIIGEKLKKILKLPFPINFYAHNSTTALYHANKILRL